MTASRPEPARRRCARHATLGAAAAAAALLLAGCASKPPPLGDDFLLPLTHHAPWLPEPSDRAATAAAAAALSGDGAGLEHALADVAAADDVHKGEDLEVLCADLVHATLDDRKAYRAASRALKSGWGTDPALEARLDMAVKDDPLKLAWARRRDTWEVLWARTFNAASRPAGQALFSGGALAPLTIATSAANYLASFSNDEPLGTFDRQALAHRKRYLALNPDAEDAEQVAAQVAGAEKKLVETMHRRRLRAARRALHAGQDRRALWEARRALQWGPNARAEEILAEAEANLARERELRDLSLAARAAHPTDAQDAWARGLATELMLTSSTGAALSEATLRELRSRMEEPGQDEARFVFAMTQREAGLENESRRTLRSLAREGSSRSNMARHAGHLVADPWHDPYGAFREVKRSKGREEARWRLFANYAFGTRYPNLPKPVAYTVEAPNVAHALLMSPVRLIFGRWNKGPDFHTSTAVLGYRYLVQAPAGPNRREVMDWLYDYERKMGNHAAALRLADQLDGVDEEERSELAEAASERAIETASQIRRVDQRTRLLRSASQEMPDTEAAHRAGLKVRRELQEGSPQAIRMTRSFLKENPSVSGPSGLDLNPILLNGAVEDGELHPDGVAFVGGRTLRFDFVPESGDEDDEPETRFRDVSRERLARTAAMLDETTRRNQLVDPDDRLEPDADRDAFLERARLGLVEAADMRPTAQSTYVYRSMRERYGLVRGRESVLPFDLVFQGSFNDFNLAAFPRWRKPKETPDAFLYK